MSELKKLMKVKVKNLKKLTRYGFDSRYVCDEDGNVFLIKKEERNFVFGKAMSPFITKDEYVEYVLTKANGKKQHLQAQIICCNLWNGIPKTKTPQYINHKDGNRQNNNKNNLESLSQSANIQHSYDKLGKVPWNKGKKLK